MEAKKSYEGREQAWVKHWLLERYLQRLIMKVGTKWKRFTYIDAFAGPWDAVSEDLSDTSFGIAVKVMRDCQKALSDAGTHIPMRAIFCEMKAAPAKRLIAYAEANSTPSLVLEAHHADFTTKIESIAADLRDDEFTFALIDPTGYSKIAPGQLSMLLKKRSVEVLINLMWEHIERFWDLEQIEETLDSIFGKDRKLKIAELGGAELYAVGLRAAAGSSGGRLWASSFPVQNPNKKRTRYFLVYGTHSTSGLLTFDRVVEETWHEQALTKAQIKVNQQCGTLDLFDGVIHSVQVERPIDELRIRKAWLARLGNPGTDTVASETLAAELLEECGCLELDLQRVLAKLCDEGLVTNLSMHRKRARNTVHWQKSEILRRN